MLLVSSDYSILYMLFIASRYFVFYFTFLYNAGPLSHLTYLLIHYALLFIINKLEGGDIIRVAWLNRNVVSLKKSIKNYNDELNYYTLIIIIYTLVISRPLFLGIILLILYIIALLKYECTILHHSKQSHGTVNVGKFMYICFGGYTIKILCMPLFCMCTQYTLIWQNISQNYSNYKNDIFIGKQYIIIYYELIPQIKHIMSFNIAQGIITDINNFFNLMSFIIHRCYTYFQLQFFFLLYTTVLLIIHVDRSLYLWKGNSQGRGVIILYTLGCTWYIQISGNLQKYERFALYKYTR